MPTPLPGLSRSAARRGETRFSRAEAGAPFQSLTQRSAFSFSELVVCVALLVVLFGIFIPYFSWIRESERRARCSDNLRAIGTALREYAQHNNAAYPQVAANPKRRFGYTAFTGGDVPDMPGKPSPVAFNDVTASLWLLVRTGQVPPEKFVCPSTTDTPDPLLSFGNRVRADQRGNFSGRDHLSYSYCSPFSVASGFRLTNDNPPDFALMADRNPGAGAFSGATVPADAINSHPLLLARVNSRNHGGAGQNVLYVEGYVEFNATPYCGVGKGWERDNIYTVESRIAFRASTQPATTHSATRPSPPPIDAPGIFSRDLGPASPDDSFLVPAEGD